MVCCTSSPDEALSTTKGSRKLQRQRFLNILWNDFSFFDEQSDPWTRFLDQKFNFFRCAILIYYWVKTQHKTQSQHP